MDTKQLNFATSVVGAVLGKHPTTSIGIILAPHLVSEKVSGGHRGEIRFLDPHPLAPFNFFCKARVSPSVLSLQSTHRFVLVSFNTEEGGGQTRQSQTGEPTDYIEDGGSTVVEASRDEHVWLDRME